MGYFVQERPFGAPPPLPDDRPPTWMSRVGHFLARIWMR
jgi:hypothetical protein